MQQFIKNFQRRAPGVWACTQLATLDLPSGRIQVNPGMVFQAGEKFMNVDLASMLEEQHEKDQQR